MYTPEKLTTSGGGIKGTLCDISGTPNTGKLYSQRVVGFVDVPQILKCFRIVRAPRLSRKIQKKPPSKSVRLCVPYSITCGDEDGILG